MPLGITASKTIRGPMLDCTSLSESCYHLHQRLCKPSLNGTAHVEVFDNLQRWVRDLSLLIINSTSALPVTNVPSVRGMVRAAWPGSTRIGTIQY
jgi:hypothetical protein